MLATKPDIFSPENLAFITKYKHHEATLHFSDRYGNKASLKQSPHYGLRITDIKPRKQFFVDNKSTQKLISEWGKDGTIDMQQTSEEILESIKRRNKYLNVQPNPFNNAFLVEFSVRYSNTQNRNVWCTHKSSGVTICGNHHDLIQFYRDQNVIDAIYDLILAWNQISKVSDTDEKHWHFYHQFRSNSPLFIASQKLKMAWQNHQANLQNSIV